MSMERFLAKSVDNGRLVFESLEVPKVCVVVGNCLKKSLIEFFFSFRFAISVLENQIAICPMQ